MTRAISSIVGTDPESHQEQVSRSTSLSCYAFMVEGDGVVTTIKIKNAKDPAAPVVETNGVRS